MADKFNWRCPFCGHNAVIESEISHKSFCNTLTLDNKYDVQYISNSVTVCPNDDCNKYTLTVTIHDQGEIEPKNFWRLIPESFAKVFPDYIPQPLIQDYNEACSILDKSPKAAATLDRRCLQGLIRDYWNVTKSRLVDEINAIQDKLDPITWEAIDSLRKLGNIGAHMEQDINVIVDVDPNEAEALVKLIETLLVEWYVARHERQQRMANIKSIASKKEAERKPNTESDN